MVRQIGILQEWDTRKNIILWEDEILQNLLPPVGKLFIAINKRGYNDVGDFWEQNLEKREI